MWHVSWKTAGLPVLCEQKGNIRAWWYCNEVVMEEIEGRSCCRRKGDVVGTVHERNQATLVKESLTKNFKLSKSVVSLL